MSRETVSEIETELHAWKIKTYNSFALKGHWCKAFICSTKSSDFPYNRQKGVVAFQTQLSEARCLDQLRRGWDRTSPIHSPWTGAMNYLQYFCDL